MTRTIRTLCKKILTAGAFALPLAAPSDLFAQAAVPEAAAPGGRVLTSKELHQHLARGSGWIQIRNARGQQYHGTGWIIDLDKKLMVTNNHVIDGVDTADVIFPVWKNGKLVTDESAYATAPRVKATVIDRDKNRDLALIKLETIPAGMHALKVAADEPDEGEDVRLIGGFTNGGDGLVFGAVAGVVRAVGPQTGWDGGPKVRHVLSNAPSNGGNSGSAVVNAAGELVGVHCASKRNATNVSMHVSVSELKEFTKEALPLVDPKTAKEFVARGKRRVAAGRTDAAITDLSAALALDARFHEALFLRGKAFVAKGDPRTGLEDLNAALAATPDNYDYRIGRGVAHRALGKFDDAASDFSAAVRIDPAKPTAYNERGITHVAAKRFAEAEADYTRAIEASKEDPVLWANRADVRMTLKTFADAADDWNRAAKLAPWNPYYPNELGITLLNLGKAGDAAGAFSKAVEASGGHPLYLSNLGEALRQVGEFKLAIKAFSDAIKKWEEKGTPKDATKAYAGRGMANRELKQYRDAVDDLTRAIDLSGGTVAWYYLERAATHKAAGAENAAADDLATAARLDPRLVKVVEAANPLVGHTWKGVFVVNGVKHVHVITFNKDGTFECEMTMSSAFGAERATETGTYTVANGKLTLRGDQYGTVARKIAVNGDEVEVVVEEIGRTVTFSKLK